MRAILLGTGLVSLAFALAAGCGGDDGPGSESDPIVVDAGGSGGVGGEGGAAASGGTSGVSGEAGTSAGTGSNTAGSGDKPPACNDGVANGQETDVDCGGPCGPCEDGRKCNYSLECKSGDCINNVCTNVGNACKVLEADECLGCCADAHGSGKTLFDETTKACACGECTERCSQWSVCGGPLTKAPDECRNCFNLAFAAGKCTKKDCSDSEACSTYDGCISSCKGSCSNGITDGDESDTDCGGTKCPACNGKRACNTNKDCVSNDCVNHLCEGGPSCQNGIKDAAETGVDCGGPQCPGCKEGLPCTTGSDCSSGTCYQPLGVCAGCSNALKDGLETDVDCGGPTCSGCGDKKKCQSDDDCANRKCANGLCISCNDGVKNGDEIAIDCGGSCGGCKAGETCATNQDCASNSCVASFCVNCQDSLRNGTETDNDCGGPGCAPCGDGRTCKVDDDCLNQRCIKKKPADAEGMCISCKDGVKNGDETDFDCGGKVCPACGKGGACLVDTDCSSKICDPNTKLCVTCDDGMKNGTETAVDCGGGRCSTCGPDKACLAPTDCTSGDCTNGKCK